jgi:hypothetical protein
VKGLGLIAKDWGYTYLAIGNEMTIVSHRPNVMIHLLSHHILLFFNLNKHKLEIEIGDERNFQHTIFSECPTSTNLYCKKRCKEQGIEYIAQ